MFTFVFMTEITKQINEYVGFDASVKSREPEHVRARLTIAYLMREENYPLKAIASELNISGPAAALGLVRSAKRNKSKLLIN